MGERRLNFTNVTRAPADFLKSLFDPEYYSSQLDGLRLGPQNGLKHYLSEGWQRGLNPHPLFFSDYYAGFMPAHVRLSPLEYYLEKGWKENVSPSPFFDPVYYARQVPPAEVAGVPPLVHFVKTGCKKGLRPSHVFSTTGIGRWTSSLGATGVRFKDFVKVGLHQRQLPELETSVELFRSVYPEAEPPRFFIPNSAVHFRSERPHAAPPPHKPVIFLHIPRTGGTSLQSAWMRNFCRGECLYIYNRKLDPFNPDREFVAGLRELSPQATALFGHVMFGAHQFMGWESAAYATLLRHPVDRVVSVYRHASRDPHSEYYRLIRDGLTLREFVESETTAETNNYCVRTLCGPEMIKAEPPTPKAGELARKMGLKTTLRFESRQWLENAFEKIKNHFCFVGTTDRLEEAVGSLATALGWTDKATRRLNVSPPQERPLLDDESRKLIENYNQLDLELYQRFQARTHENFCLL